MKFLFLLHFASFRGRVNGAIIEGLGYAKELQNRGHDSEFFFITSKKRFEPDRLKRNGYALRSGGNSLFHTEDGTIPITIQVIDAETQTASHDFIKGNLETSDVQETSACIRSILQTKSPDYVFVTYMDLLGAFLVKSFKIPVRVGFQSCEYNNFKKITPVVKETLKYSYITTVSTFVRKRVKEVFGFDSQVVYPWIDPSRFLMKESNRDSVYIVQINPDLGKGAIITYALAKLLPKYKFAIIKNWSNEASIFEVNPLPNVEIWPVAKDMKEYYARAKLVLVPSLLEEAFGMVPIEAGFNRIPVIANNIGGLKESLGKGGYLINVVKPGSDLNDYYSSFKYHTKTIQQYSKIIQKLMEDKKAYIKAQQRAYVYANQMYRKIVASNQKCYRKLESVVKGKS